MQKVSISEIMPGSRANSVSTASESSLPDDGVEESAPDTGSIWEPWAARYRRRCATQWVTGPDQHGSGG